MGLYSISLLPCPTASSPTWFPNSYLCPWRCGAEEGRNGRIRKSAVLSSGSHWCLLIFFWAKNQGWIWHLTHVGSQLSLKTHQIRRDKRVLPALWQSPPGKDITWLQKMPRFRKFGIPKNTCMCVLNHWQLTHLLCSLLRLGIQAQHLDLLDLGPSDFSRNWLIHLYHCFRKPAECSLCNASVTPPESWLPQNQHRSSHRGSGFPGWTLPDTFHCGSTNKQMDAMICTLALVS